MATRSKRYEVCERLAIKLLMLIKTLNVLGDCDLVMARRCVIHISFGRLLRGTLTTTEVSALQSAKRQLQD